MHNKILTSRPLPFGFVCEFLIEGKGRWIKDGWWSFFVGLQIFSSVVDDMALPWKLKVLTITQVWHKLLLLLYIMWHSKMGVNRVLANKRKLQGPPVKENSCLAVLPSSTISSSIFLALRGAPLSLPLLFPADW